MDPNMEHDDSDTEEDPARLLNQWLGELNTLKRGLDVDSSSPTVMRSGAPGRRQQPQHQEYRCSLINLDTSQDDELDAILGELTVLESQFDQEITADRRRSMESAAAAREKQRAAVAENRGEDPASPGAESDRSSSNMTDLGIHSNSHSRSSSGSDQIKPTIAAAGGNVSNISQGRNGGSRMESPDTDSAFCDNLSVLSSCSSSNQTGSAVGGGGSSVLPSTLTNLTKEEQEARIKAEKIKIAIEKIKEASVKKLFIKVFTSDGSAKSLLVDEKMSVGQVTRILAEKNHVALDPKWALVELVPDLYMERVYEDHEQLVENCLLWKVDSKNTLWFIERPEKFDLFSRPEVYLLGSSSSQKDDQMEDHSRQELLEEYFNSSGVGAPQVEGTIWLKADSKKSWKKFYFVLRTSGLYYAPKGKKTSKDLVCLTTFDVNQVYYGVGWRGKYKAPTDFCFGIKHPQIQAKNPKYIKYLCVDTQRELHLWVTGIRIAKNGRDLFENYRQIVEEITHADIDILTAKRFSVNSATCLQIGGGGGATAVAQTPTPPLADSGGREISASGHESGIQSPVRTPSSENKSLASVLSSGIESDMSSGPDSSLHRQLLDGPDTTLGSAGLLDHQHLLESSSKTSESQERISGLTPVGTLERSFKLRRSFSRSSSSSGCLSDKSSGGSNTGGSTAELGFESDFPLGGTIKKRPSTAAATPRLPLTNTTWGLVRETDQEVEEHHVGGGGDEEVGAGGGGGGGGGGVVGLGAGGTLLRHAMRNSLSRKKPPPVQLPAERGQCSDGGAALESAPPPPPSSSVLPPEAVRSCVQKVEEDPLSSAFERSLSNLSEDEALPLPPPPHLMETSVTSLDDLDQLPPPPPPDICYQPTSSSFQPQPPHYHVSPLTSPSHKLRPAAVGKPQPQGLPPLSPPPSGGRPAASISINGHKAPSSGKKPIVPPPQKSSRRISFDDNVQMIEAPSSPSVTSRPSTPVRNLVSRPPQPASVLKPEPMVRFSPTPPVRTAPGKLTFGVDAEANTNSLPRAFLADLQKVMNKKWQVAEKCRADRAVTPHEVLGFRDELPHQQQQQQQQVGLYSHSSAIGAWVMETQLYAEDPRQLEADEDPYGRNNNSWQQQQPDHYNGHHHHHHHQQQLPQHYPPHARGAHLPLPHGYGLAGYPDCQRQDQPPQTQQRPVVLREPEPCYVDPSRMRANKVRLPPPPPRRSENTQLSASNY